jgi:hypothetical protein
VLSSWTCLLKTYWSKEEHRKCRNSLAVELLWSFYDDVELYVLSHGSES